ncbi:hypothetical protein, partial [Pseudohongiella acticola]|uniref:hypothetical protein n=1 Tax=Pseudohongiella acticola TaxID=1524254 RepID=UPI0030EC6BD0
CLGPNIKRSVRFNWGLVQLGLPAGVARRDGARPGALHTTGGSAADAELDALIQDDENGDGGNTF